MTLIFKKYQMQKLNLLFSLVLLLSTMNLEGQIELSYQAPVKEIKDLVDTPLPPLVSINTKGDMALLQYRNMMKSIAELSQDEMRLGGLRINPNTNINSRQRYYTDIEVMAIPSGKGQKVDGIPLNAQISNIRWSPDETKIAFTNTEEKGVALWLSLIHI